MSTGHAQLRQDTAPEAAKVTLPFVAVVLAMLPAVLDQTIPATALPTVATELGRLTDVSWVVTAYVVAAAASTPVWGKLGDRHGRKLLLEAALGMFLAASTLCGVAQDLNVLVASRTLQGVAAGGLMTLAMASVGDLVSPRERGRFQGYITAVFAVATVIGPLIGGVLVEQVSWRWVFYVNLPLGLLALAGLSRRLPAAAPDRPGRGFDAAGAAMLAGATTALMLACIWGGTRYAWYSATILALIGTAVVLRPSARAARGGSHRPARPPAYAGGRDRERRDVPGHGFAVRGDGVRPAVPAGDHGSVADAGGPAAHPDDARGHRVDELRRAEHRADRPLQAVPRRRPRADGGQPALLAAPPAPRPE